MFFFVVEPSKIKILYPKRRIESYSMMGTIVSPNKMLLKCLSAQTQPKMQRRLEPLPEMTPSKLGRHPSL